MYKIMLLTVAQCMLLAGGQVCFKLGIQKIDNFGFNWSALCSAITNWWLLASGLLVIAATMLWAYIVKHFEFSLVYPLTSVSYIFGVLAAIYIFGESMPVTRWIGVATIVVGIYFVAK